MVLRWSTPADTERVAALASAVFRDGEDAEPHAGMRDHVRRQMRGDFPFMGPDDYILVEDTTQPGTPVVACTCYLREEWKFGGIRIKVARPEIVASDPSYRNRGLIRAIFEEFHRRSEAEGALLQAITGIHYFYRQFGYEYALDLGGKVTLPVAGLPEATTTCRLRLATLDDVDFIVDCYRHRVDGSLVAVDLPAAFWRYHIEAELGSDELMEHFRVRVIEIDGGARSGFILAPYHRGKDDFYVMMMAFTPGTHLGTLALPLVHALKDMGEALPQRTPADRPVRRLTLGLGRDHPFHEVLPADWFPRTEKPYAWYMRVPDIPRFIQVIGPVLERRLAASPFTGYSGEIKINLFRGGVRLQFADGKLETVEPFRIEPFGDPADLSCPPLVFLRLLFGHAGFDELRAQYPDFGAKPAMEALVRRLFPKAASYAFGT